MKSNTKLSTSMTVTEFDNGYWYATELKEFAEAIGIPSAAKLRKDELEKAIKLYLATGKIENPNKRGLSTSGVKDVELGLRLDLPIVLYTNDKETKNFLERETQRLAPGLKRKSGVRYRLNRWREEQLTRGIKLTYEDLIKEYVRLSETTEPFAKIPHGRFINFVSDFMAAEKGATRDEAMRAWKKLKVLDVPKTYRSWVTSQGAAQLAVEDGGAPRSRSGSRRCTPYGCCKDK
ncbi:MAG TPA: SAP domain-containing protein [Pyrinomonadaceae bacterium]